MSKLQHKYPGFRIALAALDLSEMDDYIIQYSAMICKALSIERIIFVHVARSLELPDEVLKQYPDLLAPLDESIEMDLKKKVDVLFANMSGTEVDVMVKEGNPIEKVLHLTKVKEVDVLFMGRKRSLKGSGLVSSRIARKSPCSLFLVPENPPERIDNIIVPLDFSKHSALALKSAKTISDATGASLSCANLYRVPSGYHTSGKSYDEFAEIMKKHAHNDFSKFLKKAELSDDIPCTYLLTKDGDLAELLYQHCELSKSNLIVLGSRGRTAAAVVIIGSLAEKLTYLDSDIPLLIVKKKGENMSLFEALLRV